MLYINKRVLGCIVEHAREGLPYEVCGYLAQKDGKVFDHYELTNMDKAADHFSMNPEEQFAVVKELRQKKLKMRAVYHSHPETPARPSLEDIKLAYDPDLSYVIISLSGNEAVIKSFRIKRGEVSEEPIEYFS